MVVVCHINVRSLVAPGRLEELKCFVSMNGVDIICLTESWLKPKHLDSTLHIPGFQQPLRCDRLSSRGGGVAIYIRNGLASSRLSSTQTNIECLAIRVNLPKRKRLTILAVYRSPGSDVSTFIDGLDLAISPYLQDNICLLGDFNAKHTAWYKHQKTDHAGEALKHFSDSHGLYQLIGEPTYNVLSDKQALLDLIFVNQPSFVRSTSVLPPMADHCPVQVHLSLKKSRPPKPYTSQRFAYRDADVEGLNFALAATDWKNLLTGSIHDATTAWTDTLLSVCKRYIPMYTIRVDHGSKPWYSRYLKYLASCRDRLFKRSRGKNSSSTAVMAYRKIRNLFVSELRNAEKCHFSNLGRILLASDVNPRRWWSLAKRACGWSSCRQIPPLSDSTGKLATLPFEQACILNAQFSSQCSAFPPASTLPNVHVTDDSAFQFATITSETVLTKMKHLPSGKSGGPDLINNDLIKLASTCPSVSSSLASLFNRSLADGVFPDSWKETTIAPLLKDGKNATQPTSYRPIALTSCLSKLLERFVHEQLLNFCFENDILPNEQYGFLRGRSTEWQLVTIVEEWHAALDRRCNVHAVFLDAAKAFDRVDHSVLLSMISDVGIRGKPLRWLRSYLSGRRIRTRVAGCLSSDSPITSGVPQGSVLGPLLFLIYYKDLPSVIDAAAALFADDTLIYRTDCKGQDQHPCCRLSADLRQLETWTEATKTTMNPVKSAVLCLGRRPDKTPVELRGQALPQVSEKTHLGVTITEDLRWSKHIAVLMKRVSGSVTLCKSLIYRHHLHPAIIRRFYVTFIRPKLEYCNAVWCGAPQPALRRLEKVQLQIARAMTSVHTPEQALSTAGLATLSWRRREHCMVLLWKAVHLQGPPMLSKLLPASAGSRSSRCLRRAHSLEFPLSSSSRHLSSFLCVSIPIWNSLPSVVASSNSLFSFRAGVRKVFFDDQFTFGLP